MWTFAASFLILGNSMKLKPGASIKGLQSEMVLGLSICDSVYSKHGVEMVITAGTDGKHSPGSLHYVGLAVDLRTSNVPADKLKTLEVALQDSLQAQFDVILESDHFHVEFQPKS